MLLSRPLRAMAPAFGIILGFAWGCASDDEEPNPIVCDASSCSCGPQDDCEITEQMCFQGSCSLDCEADSVCVGECGESCSVDCAAGAQCDLTLGKSGSVTCSEGAICNVTCTDECSVSCGGAAECSLQCAGESEPQTLTEGGNCG